MEDARRQHGIGLAFDHRIDHVLRAAAAARGDDRHLDGIGDGARQGDVVAIQVAVGVHAGHQQLAGAQLDDLLRPLDRVEPRGAPAAVRVDLPAPFAGGTRVDGDDDALAPKRSDALPTSSGRRPRRC